MGIGTGENSGVGKWEVVGDKIHLTFPSGLKEEMSLPLNPKGTKVVGKRGRVMNGMKDK